MANKNILQQSKKTYLLTNMRNALGNVRFTLTVFLLGDVLVIATLGANYFVRNPIFGALFLLVAIVQFFFALFALSKPSRQLFLFGFTANLIFIILTAIFLTTQPPGDQAAWIIQPYGLAEVSAFIMTILALLFSLRLAWKWGGERKRSWLRIILIGLPIILIVLLLSILGTISAINNFPHEVSMSAPVPNGQQAIPVTTLHEKLGNQPVKTVTLVTQQKVINGTTVWTFNGMIPGPEIRVKQGDRLRVTVVNHLPVATSIHWHGVRLPNAEDGVAGVTQDAIKPGQTFTYEFIAKDAGTFMYHSHQDTFNQMLKGLFGALVVEPQGKAPTNHDYSVVFHESPGDNSIGPGLKGYLALRKPEAPAFNGQTGETHFDALPGETVRLRILGAIQGEADEGKDYMIAPPREFVLLGAPYKIQAIDGNDLNQPQLIGPQRIPLGIGQRYDLVFTMPQTGQVRLVDTKGKETITIGNGTVAQDEALNRLPLFDMMNYGEKTTDSVLAAKQGKFDVTYPMILQFQGGLRDDKLELIQTINRQYAPMMTQYVVKEGQLVKFHIVNKTEEFHTMHLHGHFFTVLSHNGKQVQGSPIHIDSLLVPPHDTFDIAFLADNPGLWMLHCHVLVHAAFGMSAMVTYEGYTTPYTIGAISGNKPE